MNGRFSKQNLLDYLQKQMDKIAKQENFDPNNGCVLVNATWADPMLQYGRMSMLQDLIEDLS